MLRCPAIGTFWPLGVATSHRRPGPVPVDPAGQFMVRAGAGRSPIWSSGPEWGQLEQVVPSTRRTDLDGETPSARPFRPELQQLCASVDGSTAGRQPGTEHEPDDAKRRLGADRAGDRRTLRTVERDAHQFRLGVAHVGPGQLSRAVPRQQMTPGEAVIHAARCFSGSTR